ncbi:hypothetical protein HN51_011267, partial [Arachis hypogaea]
MPQSVMVVDTNRLLLRDLENNGEDSPAAKKLKSEKFPLNYALSSPRAFSASTSLCPPPSLAASSSHAPCPIFSL